MQIHDERFMGRGPGKSENWFDLRSGRAIQGCLAESARGGVVAVYIVTMPAPTEFALVYDRWLMTIATLAIYKQQITL